MIFANNKKVADLDFKTEFVPFFVDRIFMKFMDTGRRGIQDAAIDLINNMYEFMKNRIPTTGQFSNEQYQTLEHVVTRELIDAFIRDGSKGLTSAIYSVNMIVMSTMKEIK